MFNDTLKSFQEQESPLDTGATNKAFFILGRLRSGNEYVAMVTS